MGGIAKAVTDSGGLGGLTDAMSSLKDGFQMEDLAGLAKTASGFLPPPQNMIAGAAAGMLGGGGFEGALQGAMGGLTPDGIGGALKGLGIDEGIIGGITDAAGKLQSDPSAANLENFYKELAKMPEDKKQAGMDAIKNLLPPELQNLINAEQSGSGPNSQQSGSGPNREQAPIG